MRTWHLGLAALAIACGTRPAPSPAPLPDILLVTIDTLRADRVNTTVTPRIDRLAASGIRFTAARTVAPLTLPAHVTILTGAFPPRHGVRLNGVNRFDGRVPPLARRLRDTGYLTGAFVGAYVLDRRFGLADGFDVYDDRIPRASGAVERLEAERPANIVADVAIAWYAETTASNAPQAGAAPRKPLFLWVHFYDPHAPYAPPQEFLDRAGGTPYDGEARFADHHAGRVIDAISSSGRPTLIMVAGDHGESLGEHGEPTHGMLLYEPAVRVPLVLAGTGIAPAVRSDPVSLADVAPTIAARAGLAPSNPSDGHDLLDTGASREIYMETHYPELAGWSPLTSLTDGRWKVIDAPAPELYDLSRDISETTSLAGANAGIVRGMQVRLEEVRRSETASAIAAPDAETAERLRSLGYVSGTPAARTGNAPNPATMMTAWADFEGALNELAGPAPTAAFARLQRLAREHPDSVLFQATLARALAQNGRHRDALAIYRLAVARWTNDSMLLHDLAVSARAAGFADEARRAEEAALTIEPSNAMARNGLGLLLADAGRAGDAVQAFATASAADPTNPEYVVNLGNAARAAGDGARAEQAYRQALGIDPEHADAANGLAVILVQAGRASEARALLERVLARHPDFVEARLNLGIACQEGGDRLCARSAYADVMKAPARFDRERRAARELLTALPR